MTDTVIKHRKTYNHQTSVQNSHRSLNLTRTCCSLCQLSYTLLHCIAVLLGLRRCGLLLPTQYSMICRSVWRSISLSHSEPSLSPAKTAEAIEMPFGFQTRVGPRNHVLDEVQMPTWEGIILRGRQANQYRDTLQSFVQTRLNRSRCFLGCGHAWAQSIMYYTWQVQIPMRKGNSGG